MHEMQIMGKNGHSTMTWDLTNKASITAAEEMFSKLLGEGFRAFRAGDGDKDGVMKTFDPGANEIVMAVPLVGG
jgi:hypothetical protein